MNRQQAHRIFVLKNGWSTGRAFLLRDIARSHKFDLDRAEINALDFCNGNSEGGRLGVCQYYLINAAREIALSRFAATENPLKFNVFCRLVQARDQRIVRSVKGRALP